MTEDPTRQRRRARRAWGLLLLGALLLAHSLLFTVYRVEGSSMEPTLRHGQWVWALKHVSSVKRGDLVLFINPLDAKEVLVKRAIALPGETLVLEQGKLYIDSFLHEEPYLKPGTLTGSIASQSIPADHLFLLGDDRAQSFDSRRFGPVPQGQILAKLYWAY